MYPFSIGSPPKWGRKNASSIGEDVNTIEMTISAVYILITSAATLHNMLRVKNICICLTFDQFLRLIFI